MLDTMRFISLLFTALALGAGLAHALELPNKLKLSREDYLTVQQLYRGWERLGIVEAIALLSTLILMIMVRDDPRGFGLTLVALLCTTTTLMIFFLFTLPANQRTNQWTELPANWLALRPQWEYSHAARAGLFLIALIMLILSVL